MERAVRFLIFFLIFNFVCHLTVDAQSSGESCAQISDDDRRLGCYDSIFNQTSTERSAEDRGKWIVREETSKLDDTANVHLLLISEDKHRDRFGGSTSSSISIACRENATSLWVRFADEFMSDNAGGGRVTYRIDEARAQTKNFRESNNNQALGLWNGGSSVPFIKSFLDAETLLLRATPFSASSVTATFDVRGLAQAIKPLRDACSW